MILKLKNVDFIYPFKNGLKNINFTLQRGDFLGILGPNGSGKSTLLKTMLGNLKCQNGEIFIFNQKLQDYSLKELAKIIGFLPQNSQLHTPLKVIDVLLMSKYVHLKYNFLSYSKKDLEELKILAAELKLEHFLDRNILSLSGGEFQRVLLARALLKNPQILFLDEPTSALDLNYAIELLNLCENLIKQRKISVVAVLHDLNLAALFCNKILFLKEGEIRYQGSVKQLFTKEILKEIYNLDCEIINSNQTPYVFALKEKR